MIAFIYRNLANILTLSNMFCGFLGILFVIYGDLTTAAICILLSASFDLADGLVARKLGLESSLGKEMDSFADFLSFGILPAIILHIMLIKSHIDWVYQFHFAGLPFVSLMPFILTACAAIRLGKFNIKNENTSFFTGLPTPAVALFVASLPLIMRFNLYLLGYKSVYPDKFLLNPFTILIIVLLLSFAMLADIRIIALKFPDFSWTKNKARYLLIGISIVSFVFLLFLAIPLAIVLLVIFSLIFKK